MHLKLLYESGIMSLPREQLHQLSKTILNKYQKFESQLEYDQDYEILIDYLNIKHPYTNKYLDIPIYIANNYMDVDIGWTGTARYDPVTKSIYIYTENLGINPQIEDIYKSLCHEITHIFDLRQHNKYESSLPYYHKPREIRAHLREIANDIDDDIDTMPTHHKLNDYIDDWANYLKYNEFSNHNAIIKNDDIIEEWRIDYKTFKLIVAKIMRYLDHKKSYYKQ